MLQSFEIQGYRKFDRLQLEHLKRFNFFVGDNNAGKTSLLTSIFGWACGFNLAPFFSVAIQREYPTGRLTAYGMAECIRSAFHDASEDVMEMCFRGQEAGGTAQGFRHKMQMMESPAEGGAETPMAMPIPGVPFAIEDHKVVPRLEQVVARWSVASDEEEKQVDVGLPLALPAYAPHQMARYIGLLGHRNQRDTIKIYRELKTKGKMDAFLHDFREVFPEVEELDSIPYPDAVSGPISVKIRQGKHLPLYAFGEGLQRWYFILGVLVLNPGGIFCIDEVDATLHPGAQEIFCKDLIRYAMKYDVQLFMATHNLEFIDHFLSAAKASGTEDFSIFTMKNDQEGHVHLRSLEGRDAFDARQYRLELR